jgi:hypothetical protein
MVKGEIKAISNVEDSIWYKLAPTDDTLKLLEGIFKIYDNLFEETMDNIYSYMLQTENGDISFSKETEKFVAYFIITRKYTHVILRKIHNWEKYNKEILDSFKFLRKE